MSIWQKEHQVKEKKIKQHHIKHVEGVEDILIIEGRDIAHIAVLVRQLN